MNIKELRLGNIVTVMSAAADHVGAVIVTGLLDDMVFTSKGNFLAQHVRPVELNEDWLNRFGGGVKLWIRCSPFGRPETVHRLQNLYFFVTGKELEILLP